MAALTKERYPVAAAVAAGAAVAAALVVVGSIGVAGSLAALALTVVSRAPFTGAGGGARMSLVPPARAG